MTTDPKPEVIRILHFTKESCFQNRVENNNHIKNLLEIRKQFPKPIRTKDSYNLELQIVTYFIQSKNTRKNLNLIKNIEKSFNREIKPLQIEGEEIKNLKKSGLIKNPDELYCNRIFIIVGPKKNKYFPLIELEKNEKILEISYKSTMDTFDIKKILEDLQNHEIIKDMVNTNKKTLEKIITNFSKFALLIRENKKNSE